MNRQKILHTTRHGGAAILVALLALSGCDRNANAPADRTTTLPESPATPAPVTPSPTAPAPAVSEPPAMTPGTDGSAPGMGTTSSSSSSSSGGAGANSLTQSGSVGADAHMLVFTATTAQHETDRKRASPASQPSGTGKDGGPAPGDNGEQGAGTGTTSSTTGTTRPRKGSSTSSGGRNTRQPIDKNAPPGPGDNGEQGAGTGTTSSTPGTTSPRKGSSTSSGGRNTRQPIDKNAPPGPGDNGEQGAGTGTTSSTPGTTSSAPGVSSPRRGSSTSSSSSSSSGSSSSGGYGDSHDGGAPLDVRASQHERYANGLILAAAGDEAVKNPPARGAKLSGSDKRFVEKAAAAGLYEVEAARVAVERAADPAVKEFAQMLVTHHTEANTELKQLVATRGNVELPTEVSSGKRLVLNNMRRNSGKSFDQDFASKVGIEDHEDDIKLFEKASREADDPEIRAWATKKLPILRQHLAEARKLPAVTGRNS